MTDETPDETEPDSAETDLRANEAFASGVRLGIATELGQTGFNDDGHERNHYDVFGWPRSDLDGWDEDNWLALYLRNAYARIVIEKPAFSTWRDDPDVVDAADAAESTDFERAVEKLATNHDIWSYCERVDRAAGIGQHGLLLLGFEDVAADGLEAWADDATEQGFDAVGDLTGLKPVLGAQIEDIDYGDPGSERWDLPVEYTVDLGEDIDSETEDDSHGTIRVHHSRVVDVPATRPLDDETLTRPRAEPVLNNILDIEKILGAAAEAGYRAADYGLHLNADPTKVDMSGGMDDLADELQRYEQGLQRYLRTTGVEVDRLGGDIQDPSGIVENNLDAIAGQTGIPKKEFRGNESGEVSGAEADERSYFGMIAERRQQYATPHIVQSLVDQLRAIGIVPAPAAGEYRVEWPDLIQLSEQDRADIESKRAQVISAVPGLAGDTAMEYLKGGADALPETGGDGLEANLSVDESDPAVRETFEEVVGNAAPFTDIPVIPNGLKQLSDAWLIRWAEWVAAGRPNVNPVRQRGNERPRANDWNPSLHPRDPRTGQFVERPFNLPDDAPDFGSQSRRETLEFLDNNGADLSDIFDPDSPVTVDGIPNDATSLDDVPDGDGDGSAADLRRGADTIKTGDEIAPESVEPGDAVQVGTGRLSKYVEVEEVDTSLNSPILRGTDASGSEVTAPTDGKAVLEANRVKTPEFDLDWGDDLDTRTDATLTAIEESVPTGDDAPLDYGTMPLPEDGEGFEGVDSAEEWLDEVRPQLAEGLAAARDAEAAERTLEHWGQLGDHGSAAADGSGNLRNFSGTTRVAGDDRHAIKLATTAESTAKHEVAHNLFKSFQLRGQNNDVAHNYEGDIPDFDLTSDPGAPDDIDQYTLSPPDETPVETDGVGRSFGRGEWESRVRSEVSTDLSANRFSEPDDFETWATEEASVGDMLRFEEYPLQTFDEDGPQNYRIAETLDSDEVDRAGARRGFELEGPNGESFRVGVGRGGEIKSEDIHETSGFLPDANKKRNGTPDGWGRDQPALDDVLGSEDPSDSATERIHRVGREANAAWFKMNLLKANEGESAAEEAVIGNNYSATNTHETLARLHEYMQSDVSPTTRQNTAVALVKHHPRLLESYRHAFEISDEMKTKINSALAGTDAEVRL